MTSEEVALLLSSIHKLPREHRVIISKRFGIITGEMMSINDLSEYLMMGREEIREIETAAIEFLADAS